MYGKGQVTNVHWNGETPINTVVIIFQMLFYFLLRGVLPTCISLSIKRWDYSRAKDMSFSLMNSHILALLFFHNHKCLVQVIFYQIQQDEELYVIINKIDNIHENHCTVKNSFLPYFNIPLFSADKWHTLYVIRP